MKPISTVSISALVGLVALVAVGCGPTLDTPGGFARVDGRHDLRIASPEGVALSVNVYRNRRPRGDLTFWSGALHARLRSEYTVVERLPITSDSGVDGVQIRARALRNGRPHQYWTAIFVAGRNVILVEAGGDDAFFAPQEETIEAAMRSVDI